MTRLILPVFILGPFLLTGCGAPESTSPKGPALATSPAPAKGTKRSPKGTLPKTQGNSQLDPKAPLITIGADRTVTVAQAPAGVLPAPASDFKPAPLPALTDALSRSRAKDQVVVNVKAARGLKADIVWTVVHSAARAGYTEVRWAIDGGGALALSMPEAAPKGATGTLAAHIALFMSSAGVNPKIFIGPSGTKLPVAQTRSLSPLTGPTKKCPGAAGSADPASIRSLGEPVCKANGTKDYWVIATTTLSTSVEDLLQATAAMATPKAGCSPRIALASPTDEAAVSNCEGAITGPQVAARISNSTKAAKHSAVARAARRPLLTEIDLSKTPRAVPPELAKRLAAKAGKKNPGGGQIALGRIATSDNDASRDALTRALTNYLPDFRACYSKYLIAAGTSNVWSGSLVMGLAVGADGKPKRPGFSRKGAPPDALKLCVVKKAQTWTLPTPQSGKMVQVMIPVVFRAPGA